MGLLESASFADAYSQAATAAELDALNIRYEGEGRRRGLMFEAGATRAAKPLWGPAILSAGTNALKAFSGAGGKLPAGGAPKTGRSTMALNYRGGSARGAA
jgi:hypothetical protein